MLDDFFDCFALDPGPASPLWAVAPVVVPFVVLGLMIGLVVWELIWPGDA